MHGGFGAGTDYTQRVAVWLGAVLFALLIVGCTERDSDGEGASSADVASLAAGEVPCSVQGELSLVAGSLAYAVGGQELWRREIQNVEPYCVVCFGPPALVTTVAADLTVTTHAVSQSCYDYPGMYPQVATPPVVVLSELTSELFAVLPRTVLLGEDGAITWSGKAAEYLPPSLENSDDVAYFAQAAPAGSLYQDILFPFGDTPLLTAVDPASGIELWLVELDALASVANVELWALTPEWGLLSLQYDYQLYEYLCFDRCTGEVYAQHELAGQPATRLVYPGAFAEPAALSLDGDSVEIGVFLVNGTPQMWRFNLKQGSLERGEFAALPTVREENQLPVGGVGAPGPGSAPYSQRLLPEASGNQWQIPALTDSNGAVLLVVDGKASLEPGSSADGSLEE